MPVIDSEVLRLAARGDGVTADGRHVALAAPGDRVGIDATIHPGPHHMEPPCRHFPRCGGCQLQHVDDAVYRDFLIDRVAGALAAQKLDLPEIRAPHLSPPRTRRRAALRAERLGNRVVLGFNEAASHRVVDMRECHILLPALFALVEPLRALMPLVLAPRRAAEIHLTALDAGVEVMLSGVTVAGLAATQALIDFAQAHALVRLVVDEGHGAEVRWEPEPAIVTFAGVAVTMPPGGFLQATADGEAALVAAVAEAVGSARTVADLFAGAGTFALPLAARARVLAVEGARDAALALTGAANRAGLPLMVEHRDLFRRPLDAKELGRFDAVVLDPPRAGAKEQMPALAIAPGVERLAYVSCNPATFARDVRLLAEGGWRISWVRPVGQFRWSTHVELAAALVR